MNPTVFPFYLYKKVVVLSLSIPLFVLEQKGLIFTREKAHYGSLAGYLIWQYLNYYTLPNFPHRRCTAFSYLEGDPELAYFAVYDGHGGTGVANYLKDHLHEFILDQPEYKEGNIEESVLKAFLQVKSTYFDF